MIFHFLLQARTNLSNRLLLFILVLFCFSFSVGVCQVCVRWVFMGYALCTCMHYVMILVLVLVWMQAIEYYLDKYIPSWNSVSRCINQYTIYHVPSYNKPCLVRQTGGSLLPCLCPARTKAVSCSRIPCVRPREHSVCPVAHSSWGPVQRGERNGWELHICISAFPDACN